MASLAQGIRSVARRSVSLLKRVPLRTISSQQSRGLMATAVPSILHNIQVSTHFHCLQKQPNN